MIQKTFANKVVSIVSDDPNVLGLAAGGSFITDSLDEYSDLDLILVTRERIAGDRERMLEYASRFGDLLNGFTGEHVGEPRLLICLYDNPLLHVDIKFITPDEFKSRVEDPVILFERDDILTNIISSTNSSWPQLDYQWIEDRFWIWVHYMAQKLGRGELLEAFDGLSFLRSTVLSPLAQVRNRKLPRGVRKVETELLAPDLENLKITIAKYEALSIVRALENAVSYYRTLRKKIFPESVVLREKTEKRSMAYLKEIKSKLVKR